MNYDLDLTDPSDRIDTDAQDWIDDRNRLLTDGRTVTPVTVADLRAEKRAAMSDPRNVIADDRWGNWWVA